MNLTKYANTRLLRQIQGKTIEFLYLSDHPDLTVEVIKAYPKETWDWDSILAHDNMCLDWLKQMPNAPWSWDDVPDCDRFNFSWIQALPDLPWPWDDLHEHEDFTLEWVAQFPDKPWDMFRVSALPTLDDLRRFPQINWDWAVVTHSSPIPPIDMMGTNFPWDFSELSFEEVSDDDVVFLRFYMDKFDDSAWTDFTIHTTWRVIRANSDLPWNWYYIDPDDFQQSDLELLRAHIDVINWNKMSIMLPYTLIKNNPDLPWNVVWVSMNDTLTWEDISFRSDWDYSFTPCEPLESIVRKWTAANTIKRAFKMAISNPEYTLCRNRLLREGHELELVQ